MTNRPTFTRAFDLAVVVPALAVTAPVQLAVAVAVRRRLGSPILFKQTRPGLHGKPFTMLKFRTMLEPDEADGRATDAQRLTPFGAWLRSTSLDELPALWNILRGDMSVVGPRPLLTRYLDRYSPEQLRRHEVKPGLTGLAQVSGRNRLTWDERLALDVSYVDSHTVWSDLRIIAMTILPVLLRDGVTGDDTVTMTEFLGNPTEVA
ncbi:sugar transferase [Leekyejoonella antrihumi]|uniref:Sugar transferase n=1 Tax=Leekyejoonella antrihumi TaxID=1660198 RepID=A0A563E034_9MICO|nr:sugar transferase [Leekyejoonella antrihumi]TWP35900.1 sugar transferase [Leekyejoonella antrihumi]